MNDTIVQPYLCQSYFYKLYILPSYMCQVTQMSRYFPSEIFKYFKKLLNLQDRLISALTEKMKYEQD